MVLAGEKGGMASVLPRRQAAVPEGMPEIMEALLTQVCRLTPDQLAPFAVQHLSVAHSRTLLPGTDVNWRKQPVKPSMARLKAYLDDIGFRSTMEEIVVRSIIDQPSDLIGYMIDCLIVIGCLAPEQTEGDAAETVTVEPEATVQSDYKGPTLEEVEAAVTPRAGPES
jgi:hypothetical protein